MKNLEKQQKCTMNGNAGSFDFANATAFASLKMTNNNCHAELVEASRRSRSSVIPEGRSRESVVNKKTLSRAAFTLVELVITIAIVIILSVISVPIYRGYVDKAKWSEVYALFGTVLSAQKAYYSEYGNFLRYSDSVGETSYEPTLGIDARGNKYFSWFQVGTDIHGNANYYFHTVAWYSNEFGADDNRKGFILQYNMTLGSKFADYPIPGVDHAWE